MYSIERKTEVFFVRNWWRWAVLFGCLVFLGCAQVKPAERPIPEAEKVKKAEKVETKPLPMEKVSEDTLPELKPMIDSSILESFRQEIELDLAYLKKAEEEAIKKDFPEMIAIQIDLERERLSKRKKIIEDIQRIQEDLDLIEGPKDRARLQKVVVRKLLDLSRIYPGVSADLSKVSLPTREEPDSKIQGFLKEVEEAYEENRYEDLITSYEAFIDKYPAIKISPKILTSYAIALQKRGDIFYAIEKLKEILEDEAFKINQYYLYYLLGSWLYEAGSYEESIGVYQGLERELEEQKRWVELAGVKVQMMEIAKEKKASSQEKELIALSEQPIVEEKEKKEEEIPEQPAPEIPSNVHSYLHPAELNTLDIPAEERKKKTDTAILEEANRLFDRAQYSMAIKLYQRLFGTMYEEEGIARIQEAMDRFTQKMRKEAVEIFLKAKKISDPEEKKVLLLNVREILKDINERYPTNRYAEKVRANIRIVVKEIKKVDPDYAE